MAKYLLSLHSVEGEGPSVERTSHSRQLMPAAETSATGRAFKAAGKDYAPRQLQPCCYVALSA
jgi:hypothetical protein